MKTGDKVIINKGLSFWAGAIGEVVKIHSDGYIKFRCTQPSGSMSPGDELLAEKPEYFNPYKESR